MTSFLALWLMLIALCAGVSFVWKVKFQLTAFVVVLTVTLLPTLVSLFFIPLDKDGHYNLLYSLPYLLAAAIGGLIGCAGARVYVEESQS